MTRDLCWSLFLFLGLCVWAGGGGWVLGEMLGEIFSLYPVSSVHFTATLYRCGGEMGQDGARWRGDEATDGRKGKGKGKGKGI